MNEHRAPLAPGEIRAHTVGTRTFQVMHVSGGSFTQATVREAGGGATVLATDPFADRAVRAYADAIEQAESDAADAMEDDDTPEPLTAESEEALRVRAGFAPAMPTQAALDEVMIDGAREDVEWLRSKLMSLANGDGTRALVRLRTIEQALDDLATLVPIGRMYLEALDADPEYEMLTLPEAIGVTAVRDAVERGEA